MRETGKVYFSKCYPVLEDLSFKILQTTPCYSFVLLGLGWVFVCLLFVLVCFSFKTLCSYGALAEQF